MTIENIEAPDNTGLPDTGAAPEPSLPNASAAPSVVDDSAPKSMLEAIEAAVPTASSEGEKPEAAEGDKPAVDPNAEQKPETAEDLAQMPEGLTAKAQERFQKLANSNKEVRAELERVTSVVEPFRQTLQENAVTQEQFTMATTYIGLVNKGDLEGALALMDKERQQLALHLGKPLEGVDALAGHPDLRNAVDTFQINEQQAIELARHRTVNQAQEQRQKQTQQARNTQQQEQQAKHKGTVDVDSFCKQMMKNDLDFAKVEAILLPQIQAGLLNGVPPNRWAAVVESTYKMIKASAGAGKQTPSIGTLRPTGSESPATAPKTMHEAMWGSTQA